MIKNNYVDSYRKLKKYDNNYIKLKNIFKKYFIKLNSNSKINITNSWIQFPFYHHVFSDENKSFINQIKHMQNYGDFISYDESLEILKNGFQKKIIISVFPLTVGFAINYFINVTF